jgi:tetratricopeptide (TPR) repeat protein
MTMRRRILAASFAIAALAAITFAQNPPTPLSAAIEMIAQKHYAEAAAILESLVKAEPVNGPAWSQLASARYFLKDYRGAAAAYEKNIPISGNPFSMYNLAGVYSLLGDKTRSVEWLTKALDSPRMVAAVANFDDPDFANVKGEPAFVALREKTDRKVRPCMYMDKARQLDFWIGEWVVTNPQGRKDGTSSVQRFAGGCGILENWSATYGEGGKSINFYDPAADKWFQYWIGAGGGPLRYSGVFRDNAMRYEAEGVGPNGAKVLMRLTFFNIDANTVRQLAENSADGGKTWTIGYDYKYVRAK